jgi:hypothetical protein
MENAFVALAGYRDNMERTHRFKSELPKAIDAAAFMRLNTEHPRWKRRQSAS